MKALSFLIALQAVLSNGGPWNGYLINPKLQYGQLNPGAGNVWGLGPYYSGKLTNGVYSPVFLPPQTPNSFNKYNVQVAGKKIRPSPSNTQYLSSNTKIIDNVLNIASKPFNKNYVGYNVKENNGNQNNLLYNNELQYSNDVDSNQGVKNVNRYLYIVNKTRNSELPTEYSPATQYWVTENNDNYNFLPLVPPLGPNGLYPNNDNNWKQPDYKNECYNLVDIINDLRILLRKNNISEEKNNLKALFKIIRKFIVNNNLEHAPFSVVVQEIAVVLLSANNDHSTLRESEIIQILQDFKNQELDSFLVEIRSNPEANLPYVVASFTQLLYKLQQLLIQKRYTQKSIELVINRAVQWFVPLVSYYFEKECKIKTQQYILQNLEQALNLKSGNVKLVGNRDKIKIVGGLDYLNGLQDSSGLGVLGNSGNIGNLAGVQVLAGNIPNAGGLGKPGNLGGLSLGSAGLEIESSGSAEGLESASSLGNIGSLGSPVNVDDSEKQANPAGLGSSANLKIVGQQGGLGGIGNQLNAQ